MANASPHGQDSRRALRARCAERARRVRRAGKFAALGATLGCAQVLGIPSDPEVAPSSSPSQALSTPSSEAGAEASPDAQGSSEMPGESAASNGDTDSEELVRREKVSGIDGASDTAPDDPELSESPALGLDAGAPAGGGDDVGAEPPPVDPCPGEFDRVPVDLVFIVDNSQGMAAADGEFEAALPGFATLLDNDRVDYRIILLSRHRREARASSTEAKTSVCVAAPLSGLAACPSAEPALGPRFFPYDIEIGATDSLSQALATFSEPDPFGLTGSGWSEWLRPDARKVFIEISAADSALAGAEFVGALAAAAPAQFSAEPATPGFAFHGIIGLIQKNLALDLYRADEAIEPRVCDGDGSNPDNAGEVYQELSRSTGGLRQSICPADAMNLRLLVVAADVVRRSFLGCP
jgi:hypothetical protein